MHVRVQTLMVDVASFVPDVNAFANEYNVGKTHQNEAPHHASLQLHCPAALERIKQGVPATVALRLLS